MSIDLQRRSAGEAPYVAEDNALLDVEWDVFELNWLRAHLESHVVR